MPEEQKTIRLNKAAKELNVGIPTLVEYLAKKGHQVDANPNARLTAEQYELLETAFQSERQVKENADRIEISTGSSVVIEATASNTEAAKDFSDEVIIKNFNTPKVKETPKETSKEPAQEPETEPEAETEAPAEVQPETATPKFETQVIRTSVAGVKEGKNAFDAEVRIVDKIDLSSINSRMRPTKQSKSEKSSAAKAKKEKEKAKKSAAKEVAVKTAPQPQPQEAPKPQPEPVQPKKEVEFIETQYQKLEGPKVVDKIDLTVFDKSKGHGSESRKKRKRIKKEGVKVDENSLQVQKAAETKANKVKKDYDEKVYFATFKVKKKVKKNATIKVWIVNAKGKTLEPKINHQLFGGHWDVDSDDE